MVNELFQIQKKFKNVNSQPDVKERIIQLSKIQNWILSNRDRIKEAIFKDFNKPFEETDLTEIFTVLSEIKQAKKKLSNWIKPHRVKKTLILFSHSGYIKYEPKGVVLIISPWNYPFQLAIGPLISAISAGNSVIIKPSEISKYTSQLIEDMITELFPREEIVVIQGDKDLSSQLLSLPFDHIFFTGSTQVGKIVAEAAVKNFTSTTLELGGKSPTIVDQSANLESATEKIIWGKFLNKGQTCIAPDYVLVDKSIREKFLEQLVLNIKKLYGRNKISTNKDYARIISDQHHIRLSNMIDDAKKNGSEILYGGKSNIDNRFIEPTIILANNPEVDINKLEIFGPILPIIEYNIIDEAINWINNKEAPLAIYIFSNDKNNIHNITKSTKSGGVGINEVVLQFGHEHLSFGGVKHSGVGRSHGFEGFKSFSNSRSYLKAGRFNFTKIIYPPFTKTKEKIIDFMVNWL